MGCRGWYAFLHRGKYYCFYNHWDSDFAGLGYKLVEVLEEAGTELLELLRRLFDLLANGTAKESAEWIDVHAKACGHLSGCFFEHFAAMELVDLNDNQGRLIGDHVFIEYIYAIDLDDELFHATEDTESCGSPVFCGPLREATKEFVDLGSKKRVEQSLTWHQSFPLPQEFKNGILEDMADQGYEYQAEVSRGESAVVFKVLDRNNQKCIVKIFLETYASFLSVTVSSRTSTRPMAVADLLMKEPHPNIVSILKMTEFAGNPALVMEEYDGDFEHFSENMTLPQKRQALGQVAEGALYLLKHGMVHHDIKPANILIKFSEGDSSVKAAICDFESISIPGFKFQAEHHSTDLTWGPFPLCKPDFQNRENRWLDHWAPTKWTEKFLIENHEEVNPWTIDLFAVGAILMRTLIHEGWETTDIPKETALLVLLCSKAQNIEEAERDWKTASRRLLTDNSE